MGFDAYSGGLILRTLLVGLLAALLGLLLASTELYATAFITALAFLIALFDLVRHGNAIADDLERIAKAVAAGELAPALPRRLGRLGQVLRDAVERLGERGAAREAELARLRAEVEHAPVALLALAEDGRIDLLNRAARRLFEATRLQRFTDAEKLDREFAAALAGPPGRRMVSLALGQVPVRAVVSTSRVTAGGHVQAIASLQTIESELAAGEIRAWSDLTRVLAHEMMNSLTPVASLAGTASLLLDELKDEAPAAASGTIGELSEAMAAIGRRSAGLMRFIDGYRRFAEPPAPVKSRLSLTEIFGRVRALMAAAGPQNLALEVSVVPPDLEVDADPDLLEQALINLVKNAVEAAGAGPTPRVSLSASLDARGRVAVTVTDNGPGLPPDLVERIFVPFFTTKPSGSGIGLSLVRQIMVAHGGAADAVPAAEGAVFRLVF